MNVVTRPAWTLESFLAWERQQEGKYEFDGRGPVEMNGGTLAHTRIATDIALALGPRLDPKRFEVVRGDLKVVVGGHVRYPDVVVLRQTEDTQTDIAPEPVAVFEVLSPSTRHVDMFEKNVEYAATPSILHYVMLAYDRRWTVVCTRIDDGWTSQELADAPALTLPAIGVEVPFDEIYRRLSFSATRPEAAANVARSYDGPIIDAHHHLWDLSLGRHPWLAEGEGAIKALGDIGYMRRDYLVADYLADIGTQPVVGSVYIEAVWDRTRPPTEEVDWLQSLPRPGAIASRCIAWAPLRSPDVEATLAALAQRPAVVGVRETVRWHPDPAKSWTTPGLMDDADWRRGAAQLGRHGMLLELLMNPYQADELARLAASLPDQTFVVNHCGTPVDRDVDGLDRWRAGLARMAREPNISIKVSNYAGYASDRSPEALRRVVMTCVDAFGTGRAMFGTDYPVGRRTSSYEAACEGFRDAISDLTADEQRALFHDNSARMYRFDPT